jgi:Tfp pilus assembly protein PilO
VKTALTTRQVTAIGLAVAGLVLGIGSYFLVVAPEKSRSTALQTSLDTAQTTLTRLQQEHSASHARPKPKPLDVGAADLFRVTKAMPDAADVPGVIRTLTRLVKARKLELVSLQPAPQNVTTSGYAILPIALTVHGTFTDVSRLIRQLDDAVSDGRHLIVTERLLVPVQVSLTSTDGKSVDASIALNAFVYGVAPPTPPTAAAPTTTAPSIPAST